MRGTGARRRFPRALGLPRRPEARPQPPLRGGQRPPSETKPGHGARLGYLDARGVRPAGEGREETTAGSCGSLRPSASAGRAAATPRWRRSLPSAARWRPPPPRFSPPRLREARSRPQRRPAGGEERCGGGARHGPRRHLAIGARQRDGAGRRWPPRAGPGAALPLGRGDGVGAAEAGGRGSVRAVGGHAAGRGGPSGSPRAAGLQPLHPRAGGGMAAAEPDGAHLHRRRRRGHGGHVVRGRAALPPLLPGTGGAPTAAFSPRGASGGAERGLCLCPGDRAGGNDGSGARRGADRGDGGGEGAGRQGHVQRRRALQPPVELQATAERNLREWFPPLCPSSNVLTKAPRRLRVLPQALWSPHVPILQGPRFVRLGADLEENTAGASPRAYPAGCVPSTAWEGRAPVTAIKGFL